MSSKVGIIVLLILGFSISGHSKMRVMSFPALDQEKLHDQEVLNEKLGNAPQFAVDHSVSVNPFQSKDWDVEGNDYVWRVKVFADRAVSLNFAFTRYRMSQNSTVTVYSEDFAQKIRPFTVDDNNIHNELWTPVIYSESVIIELRVPKKEFGEVEFVLGQVNQGFRTFTQSTQEAGSCNVDVVCKEGDDWKNEINSVGVLSMKGRTFCSGFMVNNANNDKKPLFMTAHHCRISSFNAASLVVYWNYQASECGGARNGRRQDFNTGSKFLASFRGSDFALVELLKKPDPSFGVSYAGWDNRDLNTATAVAIHHPATDEKSISFEYDQTTTTSYLKTDIPGDGSHVRVEDWDVGTTEPGSSGSPLFNDEHRVIGQLHGGYASCSSQTADWYGRFHTSWEGGGTAKTRLKDWLDPENTGIETTDTI